MSIAKRVWIVEAPPDSYGLGTAFDTEEEARDEAEAWGGFEVHGPYELVPVQRQGTTEKDGNG